MIKLIATTFAAKSLAITASVTSPMADYTAVDLSKIGDSQGFDAGKIGSLGTDCITFTA